MLLRPCRIIIYITACNVTLNVKLFAVKLTGWAIKGRAKVGLPSGLLSLNPYFRLIIDLKRRTAGVLKGIKSLCRFFIR